MRQGPRVLTDTVAKLFLGAQPESVYSVYFSVANEFSNSIINGTKNGSDAKLVLSSATFIDTERIFYSATLKNQKPQMLRSFIDEFTTNFAQEPEKPR